MCPLSPWTGILCSLTGCPYFPMDLDHTPLCSLASSKTQHQRQAAILKLSRCVDQLVVYVCHCSAEEQQCQCCQHYSMDPNTTSLQLMIGTIMPPTSPTAATTLLYLCRPRPSQPFTPYSSTLGNVLRELHRSLLLALAAETHHTTTTQIIKVCPIVVAMEMDVHAPPSTLSVSRYWLPTLPITN